jgi:hypothetical protein
VSEPQQPTGIRPFLPADLVEDCEECHAGPGQFCRPGCGSGYTAEDYRKDAARAAGEPPNN